MKPLTCLCTHNGPVLPAACEWLPVHLLFHKRSAPETLLRDAALLADIRHACCAAGRLRRHDRSRYQLGRLMLPKLTGTLSCVQSRKRHNNGDMMMLFLACS